jgi:hypothetical protein
MACGGFPADALALIPAASVALQIPQVEFRPLGVKEFMALHAQYRKGDSSPLLASLLAVIAQKF